MVVSAGGARLGKNVKLRLPKNVTIRLQIDELSEILQEYKRLPVELRQPTLPASRPPKESNVPRPPPGGLILRCHCSYLEGNELGQVTRSKEYYYKENPKPWEAETQTDTFWMTEKEWKSLAPRAETKVGDVSEVPGNLQARFFSTVGIEYMAGSRSSLDPRQTTMTLTVQSVSTKFVVLSLDGYGSMGVEFEAGQSDNKHGRGCEVRLIGKVVYDLQARSFKNIEIAGVGEAWGGKGPVRIKGDSWLYGISCEIVSPDSPINRIPPYNLLHHRKSFHYFQK